MKMDQYRKGTKAHAERQAKLMSEDDRQNYYHVIKKGSKYTASRYYDKNSIERYSKGKICLG